MNNNGDYNDNSEMEMNENSMSGGRRRRNHTRKNRKNNTMMGGAKMTVGSKAQVYHGTAKHTSGGLTKKDLMKTKRGRIVSRKKHSLGKKAVKNLRKAGYIATKGSFKLFKK